MLIPYRTASSPDISKLSSIFRIIIVHLCKLVIVVSKVIEYDIYKHLMPYRTASLEAFDNSCLILCIKPLFGIQHFGEPFK